MKVVQVSESMLLARLADAPFGFKVDYQRHCPKFWPARVRVSIFRGAKFDPPTVIAHGESFREAAEAALIQHGWNRVEDMARAAYDADR